MTFEQVAAVALIAAAGALLQGALGFGIALFCLPLIVWLGVDLPVAIAVVQATAVAQLGWGCWTYRAQIAWRPVLGVNAMRAVTLPLGLASLVLLVEAGEGPVKLAVGAGLLVAVGLRTLVRVTPGQQKVRWWWAALAGAGSGYTGGVLSMSGPPIVLWATAHDWSSDKLRVMIWACLLPLVPVNMAVLIWLYGWPVVHGALLGAALAPLTVLGAIWGTGLGSRVPAHRLRGAALLVLVLLALATIVEPLRAMWGEVSPP